MKQRTALMIAAVVTAFLLVTAGGVLARVALTSASTGTADAATTTDVANTAALDPQVEALVQQREAQYQAQLTAANNKLQEAYAQQQALALQLQQAQSAAQSASAASAATTSTGYAITPEQAVLLALSAAPGNSAAYLPDLVSFQGIPAYEVALSGGLVYVDATTGDVLYNGATTAGFGVPSLGGESHEGHEQHEGQGGDNDD